MVLFSIHSWRSGGQNKLQTSCRPEQQVARPSKHLFLGCMTLPFCCWTNLHWTEVHDHNEGQSAVSSLKITVQPGLYVLGLINQSAARKAGIGQGDQILEVDGVPMRDQSPFEAAAMIQGGSGATSSVSIKVQIVSRFSRHFFSQKPAPENGLYERGTCKHAALRSIWILMADLILQSSILVLTIYGHITSSFILTAPGMQSRVSQSKWEQ